MAVHSQFTGDELHEAFHYVQETDPGAVGYKKYWLQVSTGSLKRRNAGNDGWDSVGAGLSDPTTTKGDLIVRSASVLDRLPVGTNGQVLTADSGETLGVKWAAGGGGGSVPQWVTDSPDNVPVSPHAMDDEFSTGTLNAKWTWYNQGSAAYSASNSIGRIIMPNTGGSNPRWITQPIPVGNWRVTAKLRNMPHPSSTTAGVAGPGQGFGTQTPYGLGVRLASNTRSIQAYIIHDSTYRCYVQRWTGTTFSATPFFFDTLKQQEWLWSRIEASGTNYLFSLSFDGIFFFQYAQEAQATWAACDEVGIVMDSRGTENSVFCDYFRAETLP